MMGVRDDGERSINHDTAACICDPWEIGKTPVCPVHGSAATVERTVMVTGSRDWRDREKVEAVLGRIVGPDDTVLHGGAAGADRLAHDWCRQLGFKEQSFAPDYKRPSPQRYHERNDAMLDRADVVVAFWDGESRGTRSVILKAVERALPLEVVR